MSQEIKPELGAVSAMGTYILLCTIAFLSGKFTLVIFDLFRLFTTGSLTSIEINEYTFLIMLYIIAIAVVVDLAISFPLALVIRKKYGDLGSHSVAELLTNMKEGNIFLLFFGMVVLEEVIARWFFLGLLRKISWFSGPFGFFLMFLIGNGLWALVHIKNYKKKEIWHPVLVLPQFIAGFFFSYLFVKYGLIASILGHFASNAVLLCVHKKQNFDKKDVMIICYTGFCFLFGWFMLDKPITDVFQWFSDGASFKLEGWRFWDYVWADMMVGGLISFIFGVLMYDRGNAGKKLFDREAKLKPFIFIRRFLVVMICLYFIFILANYLMSFIIPSLPYRVLILGILICLAEKGASCSAMARTFWSTLPQLCFAFCCTLALGFPFGVLWMVVSVITSFPERVLVALDD